jgi:hypothetical protein
VHELTRPWSKAAARPGQGWIVVRAPQLAADAILSKMRRGDFCAPTGIEPTDIQTSAQRVSLTVKDQPSVRVSVQFIGRGGRVLEEVTAAPCAYAITGSAGCVRAKVTDSNGLMAWTQQVIVPSR